MKCIRRAMSADAAEITDLRIEAYSRAKEYKLTRPWLLNWAPEDETGVVLAVWDDAGRPISTCRGTIVWDKAEAEEKLTCSVTGDESSFPALLLSKAATRAGAGGAGLHSVLRYYFLLSVVDTAVNSVVGVVYNSAPRTNLMSALGYIFEEPARFWDPEGDALQTPLVAWLARTKIRGACETLRDMIGPLVEEYKWRGERLSPDVWGLPSLKLSAVIRN
jgi:hypothetical protein